MGQSKNNRSRLPSSLILVMLGFLLIVAGWWIPSKFKSVPLEVLREAGHGTDDLATFRERAEIDENVGAAKLFTEASRILADSDFALLIDREVSNIALERWGMWDPFLRSALEGVPESAYSSEPGAIGAVLSRECREAMGAYLKESRNSLVREILESGELTEYQRLFPVFSSSGRPLEATLYVIGVLAQGERFSDEARREIRRRIWQAQAGQGIEELERFYLDMLSLGRLFDFGQLKLLVEDVVDLETFNRFRYVFHRKPDSLPLIYAASVMSSDPSKVMGYLKEFGDDGLRAIQQAVSFGKGSVELLAREGLPVEGIQEGVIADFESSEVVRSLAAFSLKNPDLSLGIKYGLYFLGSLIVFWGTSRMSLLYRESVSPVLGSLQRAFIASASVLVLVILSEPYLAGAVDSQGYSFKLAVPVISEVAGETVIIETPPTTSMDPATILSIAFFFLLQTMVFLICLLKVREIDKREVDTLVKLRLMENEENLFDSGLYVGIAGTCIALVMQVLQLIDANLLAAYSSNLFGILCVAIVKIRLVRPYKVKLILASEEQIAALGKAQATS